MAKVKLTDKKRKDAIPDSAYLKAIILSDIKRDGKIGVCRLEFGIDDDKGNEIEVRMSPPMDGETLRATNPQLYADVIDNNLDFAIDQGEMPGTKE